MTAGEVLACPDCDGVNLSRLSTRGRPADAPDRAKWYCRECQTHHREPTRRDAYDESDQRRCGLARRLADADPEEVAR